MAGSAGVVEVAGGRLGGVWRDPVWTFSGVPYAAPPVGPLRWRPPAPVEPWPGVRPAAAFGPAAPQAAGPGGLLGGVGPQDEDCLTLNVWTPALDGARPVMVWIHGGSFTSGSGANFLYRGAQLAARGDVVIVTCNYRLGALGFLAHPAAADGGPLGNYGLADQLAVLRWVRRHIERFGGDPDRVTVFGESAGAMSIAALLAVPAARGLFRRAVVESGPPYTHDRDRGRRAGEDLFSLLGMSDPERADLERVPAGDLVAATAELAGRTPPPGELPLPFLPVVDGDLLPDGPLEALAHGAAAGVELVTGTNRDEMTLFALADQRLAGVDAAGLLRWVDRAAPGVDPESVVAAYADARGSRGEPVTPQALWVAIASDIVFRWPTVALATAHAAHQPATYLYLFTQEAAAFDGMLGACHGLEIPFVFGTVGHPLVAGVVGAGPGVTATSDAMLGAWTSFARTGDPSCAATGEWAPWDPARRPTMVFGGGAALTAAPRDAELAVWAAHQGPGVPGLPGAPGRPSA